jgi:hypothetical protein
VFVLKTGIGAPTDHKENKHKNESFRRKMVGGKRTKRPGKKKREVISLRLNLYIQRNGVTG